MQRTLVCLVVGAALLGGCKKAEPTPGAVKVQVTYSGFRPACVRVTAWDVSAPGKQQSTTTAPAAMDFPLTEAAKHDHLTVAAFRDASWSRSLKFKAESFERGACEVLADKTVRVLDGAKPVDSTESGTVETQDGKSSEVTLNISASDVDGDGYVTSSDVHKGTDCNDTAANAYPGAPEVCDGIDNNCDAAHQVDEGVKTAYYLDNDGDGYGTTASRVDACSAPGAKYITQDGDCNDGTAAAHPGASEVCDGIDNNCDPDHQIDEGFNAGQSCTAVGLCNAKMTCTPDGLGTTCTGVAATAYYVDADGDGHGTGQKAYVCPGDTPPAGSVTLGDDCDDGDPFNHPGQAELCDKRDNDCNAATDEASICPAGGGSFASVSTGASGTPNWRSVSTWGSGGVWMVGESGKWARKPAGQSSFSSGVCGGSTLWYALWIDPRAGGYAFYGGSGQRLAQHAPDSTGCNATPQVNSTDYVTRGLTGVPAAPGQVQLQGVGQATTDPNHSFAWDGVANGADLRNSGTDVLRDIHGGVNGAPLFAVGEVSASNAQFSIFRFNSGANAWGRESAPSGGGGVVNLYGVYVVNARLAYAVGDSGTVLRWDGTSWQVIPTDASGPTSTERLRSVLAFGPNSVYVVSEEGSGGDGSIYRYNGTSWQKLADKPGGVLFDIAGTRPDDLWVVGSSNKVYHWPQ